MDITAQQFYDALEEADYVVLVPDSGPDRALVDSVEWDGDGEDEHLVIEAVGLIEYTIFVRRHHRIKAETDHRGTYFRVATEPYKIVPLFMRHAN